MKASESESPTKSSPVKSDKKAVKRRRDADQRILDQFWLITDPIPAKRFRSLQVIVDILKTQNDSNGSNDLNYCLDRVIRGMASARQFARHGFCVLLTQILTAFESKVSLESIFSLSERHLGKINEVSNHDSVIGWSLVVASLLQSERLTPDVDQQVFQNIFEVLYTLGMKKQYIELVVAQLMDQLFTILQNNEAIVENVVFSRLKSDLKENGSKIFFVYICLLVIDKFPKISDKNGSKSISKVNNLDKISVMIKESTAYQPSVHPFNRLVTKYFITNSNNDFTKFWNQCVNDSLFAPNNIEKGLLGFEMVKLGLELMASAEHVPTIISSSFVRLFIQSLSLVSHPLHSAANQLCQFIHGSVKKLEDPSLQLEIVDSFTKPPGSLLFDDISKSKFLANLLKNLNSDAKTEWIQRLQNILISTDKVESNDILRNRCVQQISTLSQSLTSSEDNDILFSNAKFLFFYSYFDVNQDNDLFNKPNSPINDNLRRALRDAFRNVLTHSLHSSSKTIKEKLISEVNGLTSMVTFIRNLVANEAFVCLADSKFLEPFNEIVQKITKLKKILKSKPSKENEIRVFLLFYSLFCIQVFEDCEEITNVLPDLNECMRRATAADASVNNSDSTPDWADVLTDLIISMLTTTSRFTTNILFSGFKHICRFITNTGLQRLVDSIIPSNDQFNDMESSDEEEGEEMDDKADEDQGSDEQSEQSESDEDNDNMDVDEMFRNEVITALGAAAQNDDDEESIYMSDSEMFQIDESLANVFKARFADKKNAIEKRQSIADFRTRCLELVKIFVNNKDIDLDQVFQLIEPIVAIAKSGLQSAKSNQLSTKAIQLIFEIIKIKDVTENSLEVNSISSVLDQLISILDKTPPQQTSNFHKAVIQLVNWTISLSKKLFPNDNWYLSPIKDALNSFFVKSNSQFTVVFFKSLIEVHREIGTDLLDILADNGFNESIRPFKKCNAIDLLLIVCKGNPKETNRSVAKDRLIGVRDRALDVLCSELSNAEMRAQYVNQLLKLLDLCDKNLKDKSSETFELTDRHSELSSKLSSLKQKQRRKLKSCSAIIKRIRSHMNTN